MTCDTLHIKPNNFAYHHGTIFGIARFWIKLPASLEHLFARALPTVWLILEKVVLVASLLTLPSDDYKPKHFKSNQINYIVICTEHAASPLAVFHAITLSSSNCNLEMLVFWREKNRRTQRKISEQGETQPTYKTRPGPYWWEVIVLTIAPFILASVTFPTCRKLFFCCQYHSLSVISCFTIQEWLYTKKILRKSLYFDHPKNITYPDCIKIT